MAKLQGYYIAVKRIPIMRAGKRVEIEIGGAIPEANTWPNPKAWEDTGWIRWVAGDPPKIPTPKTMSEEVTPPSKQVEKKTYAPSILSLKRKDELKQIASDLGAKLDDTETKQNLVDLILDRQG